MPLEEIPPVNGDAVTPMPNLEVFRDWGPWGSMPLASGSGICLAPASANLGNCPPTPHYRWLARPVIVCDQSVSSWENNSEKLKAAPGERGRTQQSVRVRTYRCAFAHKIVQMQYLEGPKKLTFCLE